MGAARELLEKTGVGVGSRKVRPEGAESQEKEARDASFLFIFLLFEFYIFI